MSKSLTLKMIAFTLTLVFTMSFSPRAEAWDGNITMKIGMVEIVADADNFGVRIYGPTMCGSSANWAYTTPSRTNYKALLASIMLAKALKSDVTVYLD